MNILLRRRLLGKTSTKAIATNSQTGLRAVLNTEEHPDEVDWCFRWGCTSNVGAKRFVNEARAIHLCTDKLRARIALGTQGVTIPRTWGTFDELRREPFPAHGVVIRPLNHHQGIHFAVALSPEELEVVLEKDYADYYLSEFIPKDREFRVYVVQGRVAAIAEKFVEDKAQPAWNHFLGGEFRNVRWGEWPLEACRLGVEAALAIGLDFSGVDIIAQGDQYSVLELNSAPSLTSPYRQQVFAKVFDHVVTTDSKETIPLTNTPGYRRYLHPALEKQ